MQLSREEFAASERVFLTIGRTWASLTPTEQRKFVEAEIERESEGDISFAFGHNSNS